MKTVAFLNTKCFVDFSSQYANGRQAIQLFVAETHELMAIATVNIAELPLQDDEAFIKNYSENDGILDVLIDAGILENTGKYVQSDFVIFPVCRIIDKGE